MLLTVQCWAQTAGPPLVLQGTIPGGRAGRGMAKGSSVGIISGAASAEQLATPRTTTAFVSEVVRRCPLHAVLESPRNRQSPPRPKTVGTRRPVVTWHHPSSPGRRKGLARFLPAFAPIRWSDLPGSDWFLRPATGAVGSAGHVRRTARAQDPQRDSRHVEQVLRTGRRAKGFRLRAYDRFASDLRRPPGTAG